MQRPALPTFLVLALALGTFAKKPHPEPYFADTAVDLVRLLAPPPAPGSAENGRELAQLEALEHARTPAEVAAAQADQDISVFRFAEVLDTARFRPERLPVATRFFARVTASGQGPSERAKQLFARPRPFATDTALHPVLGRPKNASYPSGHSLGGNLIAIVLADIVPERREAIFRRGWEFALQRARGGVHYPSDLEAGRVAAAVVAARLWQEPSFRTELEEARKEIRHELGLPLP